ncbi:MAG: hypothetical protein WCC52_05480 [Nitrosotalea sp.]
MSLSTNPDDKPIPARKDKNPHNYRKVGYSMIVISVSLTIIGVLSWNLASDYHFSTNIMALQEVDTMTPSSGYNIILFDTSQPVGAKLKMLDHADTFDAAQQLQSQDAAQNPGSTIQVLIFNGSKDYNLNQMAGAEVFVQTPKTGYNVVLDNYNLAVGAKLTSGSYEPTLANATAYEQLQTNQIQGQEVKILIFSSSFPDNLKLVTNSSAPVTNYTMVLPPSPVSSTPQTTTNQTTSVESSDSSNATAAPSSQVSSNKTTTVVATNQTVSVVANKTAVVATNQTVSVAANKTTGISSNQTSSTSSKTMNATTSKVVMNATVTTGVSKLINLNETISLNVTGK